MTIPDELARAIPQDVQLVYWDYYHMDEQHYIDRIRDHKQLSGTPIFAGCIWNWRPWALNYGHTFATTNAALAACKREGVREVIATLWGDDATECDLEAAMLGLQLFAEHRYCDNPTNERVARRFRVCGGADAEDFWAVSHVDETPTVPEGNPERLNPSRYLLWQNVLMGLFDQNIRDFEFDGYYQALAARLGQAATRNGEYAPMFELYETLCSALAGKSELGLRLTDAYHRGDQACLRQLVEHDMPQVADRVRQLRDPIAGAGTNSISRSAGRCSTAATDSSSVASTRRSGGSTSSLRDVSTASKNSKRNGCHTRAGKDWSA